MIFYKCDKTKCNDCEVYNIDVCSYTTDIAHAVNFENINGDYWEIEKEPILIKMPVQDEGPVVVLTVISGIVGFIIGAVLAGVLF